MNALTDPVRMRIAAANPAPNDAEIPGDILAAHALLDVIDERSGEVAQTTDPRTPRKATPQRSVPNWRRPFAGGFAVALLTVGISVLVMSDSDVPETPAGSTTTITLPPSFVPDPTDVTSGIAAAEGSLWASTEAGIVRWDLAERRAELFTAADGVPFAPGGVAVAPDGTPWAYSWNQGLAYFDGSRWSEPAGYAELEIANPRCVLDQDCDNPITALAIGPDGLVSVVTPDTLLQFDGVSWSVIPITSNGRFGGAGEAAVGSDGTLWLASGEELLAFDGDEWALFTAEDGLPSGSVNSVNAAPNGDIWVATMDLLEERVAGGIARFDGDSWTVLDESDGLYANATITLTVGADGTVWAVHGTDDDRAAGLERADGAVSRFDGATWSTTTIPGVGMGFGRGGAAVDETGTLWVTSQWGVIGFDGTNTTVLRVPEDTRPVIDIPHVTIEGGTDILATTFAKATPPVATCPVGSDPDRPGSIDQARPSWTWYLPTAMDRQSGRVIAVVPADDDWPTALETWAFDVCTNTWTLMSQPDFHSTPDWTDGIPVLVYDADSDLVALIDASNVDAYDSDTDTWTRHGKPPTDERFDPRAVYDPVSGLIVVRNIANSEMWAYDVDGDAWTPIRQGPISPPWRDERPDASTESSVFGQLHAYDERSDRIVLYLSDNGAGTPTTWSYDLRAGEWKVENTATPELHVGAFGQPYGKAVYDETAQRTVVTADGVVAGYDATRQEWEILWENPNQNVGYGIGLGPHNRLGDTIVYDPTNDRIIVTGGDARMLDEDDVWVSMNDVWAFDAGGGTWSELLAPPRP